MRQPVQWDPTDPLWLPPKPRRSRSLLIAGSLLAVALVAGVVFSLFGGPGALVRVDGGPGGTVVTIGTTEAAADFWPVLRRLAAAEGITIRIVSFSDYAAPNPALAQKQVDLNLFQHLVFLAGYNVSAGQNLVPVGSTVVVPLGVYSKRYKSVATIPAGSQVAVPNDPTNQARALLVLQQAGLIKLRGGGSVVSTPADIDAHASRVSVVPLGAQQTVAALPSVAAAVINNGFAMDADIDPSSAIYADDPNTPQARPYINAFVARAQDRDNPVYRRIVELYHDPEVTRVVVAQSRNTAVIVDLPAPELEQITTDLEEVLRGGKS